MGRVEEAVLVQEPVARGSVSAGTFAVYEAELLEVRAY